MILDSEALAAWYPFIARRWHRVALCDPMAVRAACANAEQLASGNLRDEPAAIFFAFASVRRAFPFAWKVMAHYVAHLQAQANGLRIDTDRDQLDALCTDVLYRRADWERGRAWFAERLAPLAPEVSS